MPVRFQAAGPECVVCGVSGPIVPVREGGPPPPGGQMRPEHCSVRGKPPARPLGPVLRERPGKGDAGGGMHTTSGIKKTPLGKIWENGRTLFPTSPARKDGPGVGLGTPGFRLIVIRNLRVGVPTHPRKQARQAGLAKAL